MHHQCDVTVQLGNLKGRTKSYGICSTAIARNIQARRHPATRADVRGGMQDERLQLTHDASDGTARSNLLGSSSQARCQHRIPLLRHDGPHAVVVARCALQGAIGAKRQHVSVVLGADAAEGDVEVGQRRQVMQSLVCDRFGAVSED